MASYCLQLGVMGCISSSGFLSSLVFTDTKLCGIWGTRLALEFVMSHAKVGMSVMQDPAESLPGVYMSCCLP